MLLAVVLGGCEGGVPRPRFPQLEQANEAIEGGGDRYRAHRACASDANSVDALVACMRIAGYDFIPRGPGYPEFDCWQDRDRGDASRLTPLCFVRTTAAP